MMSSSSAQYSLASRAPARACRCISSTRSRTVRYAWKPASARMGSVKGLNYRGLRTPDECSGYGLSTNDYEAFEECEIIRPEIAMQNLSRYARALTVFVMAALAATAAGAGQAPAEAPKAPLPDMQRVAAALGVTCGYCHMGRGGSTDAAVTSTGKPRLAVAREMINMTAALNASVQQATGKPANENVAVQCVTCHRGVAIPRPLTDILLQTALRQGPDAAVTQYRDLRERHYGRGAYDFGEETILNAVRRLSAARPEAAVSLAQLNLEFFPKSVNTLVAL